VKRLLILVTALSILGVGQALIPTPRALAAAKDAGSGSASAGSPTPGSAPPSAGTVVAMAQQYLGYPYAYIGDDPSTGFSCIGFAHYVFAQSGVFVPEELGKAYGSAPHIDQSALQPGDLVFFQNTVWDGISHVDLYVGDGKMIGADSYQSGVQWDNLDDSYWQDHYLGATRPLSNPTGTLLDPSAARTPSGPSLTPPGGPTLAVKAGTVLSPQGAATVYSGPAASYAAIDTVRRDTALTAVRTQGQWVNVSYDGGDQYGWVHGGDLNLPPGATGGAGSASTTEPVSGTVASQPVSGTVASQPVSGTAPGPGQPGQGSAPVQVVKGFHAAYGKGHVLTVAAGVLYIRIAPDRRARILRRVHAGDRLRLLGSKADWDYVEQRDGFRGWVNARWVH